MLCTSAPRSLVKQLEFDKAKVAAQQASLAFEEETGHYDTEWKHYVKDELEKYQKELTKKQSFAKIARDIQAATASCNVKKMEEAIMKAKTARLEDCPDLSMRRSIVHAKRILKETSIVEKTLVDEGLKKCNQKKLEASLRRAEELNLSTEITEHSKKELYNLKQLRRRLAKAICFMKRDEMGKVLALSRKMEEENGEQEEGGDTVGLRRTSYSKMRNFSSLEYLYELPVNISTYLQLELAKANAVGGGGLGDLVDLTVRIKEKIFASKASQEDFANLKTFMGLREKEDFARRRMITDSDLARGMLQFSRKCIPTSLTRLPTNLSSLAVRLFGQNILGWLGVRKFSHPHVLVQQILKVCVKVEGIRDEVYCQILKQFEGCEGGNVRVKLWVLLQLCLGAFPPSEGLENYVEFFLIKNGRVECIETMHNCVLEWRIRRERQGEIEGDWKEGGGKENKLEDIDEAQKFFEGVNFEKGATDGERKVRGGRRRRSKTKSCDYSHHPFPPSSPLVAARRADVRSQEKRVASKVHAAFRREG